jgi:hypothetical protein
VDWNRHRSGCVIAWATPEVAEDLLDESWASRALDWIGARDLLAQVSKFLTPNENLTLAYLLDGFTVREIATRLNLSHTAIVKRRRKIAALALELESTPPPTCPKQAGKVRPREPRQPALPSPSGELNPPNFRTEGEVSNLSGKTILTCEPDLWTEPKRDGNRTKSR